MPAFKLDELNFIRKHYAVDMTARELATYFSTAESVIHETAKLMGAKPSLEPISVFYTPYPFQVARNIDKCPVPLYQLRPDTPSGVNGDAKAEV